MLHSCCPFLNWIRISNPISTTSQQSSNNIGTPSQETVRNSKARVVEDTETSRLLDLTKSAFAEASNELQELKDEVRQLLQPPPQHSRTKRIAAITIAGATAAGVGLLTLGAHITGTCIAGVLGPCDTDKQVDANARDIQEAIRRIDRAERSWVSLSDTTAKKFFIVAKEFHRINLHQQRIKQTQEEMWNATRRTIHGLTSSLRSMLICTEFLFTRTQLNLLRNTITSRLQILLSALQSYRAALFSYRSTLLNSIPALASGLLPMALIPRSMLLSILQDIVSKQAHQQDYLALALPLDRLLRYYETPLVRRAQSANEGLLITLAIPLTSQSLIMDVFEALLIPMPMDNSSQALTWVPETSHIAVARSDHNIALLNRRQLEECKGPPEASICQRTFSTTLNRQSCLASLFFHTAKEAKRACHTRTDPLPKVETATNLGFGRWLVLSHSEDFHFNLHKSGQTAPLGDGNLVKGCRACILTLKCGTSLASDKLTLKADRDSCNSTGARRLDIQLADPLQGFLPQAPPEDLNPMLTALKGERKPPQDGGRNSSTATGGLPANTRG